MVERGYSFSLTTFSPSDKLVQTEYALSVVASGAPLVGIIVLATEKKQNPYSGVGPEYRYTLGGQTETDEDSGRRS
uniref:Proteasome alpha-type subunits domain-containing protein n=1 Tax=Esox lucius TaxID=8010 RepID=A0AAY5KNZ6_ESOLU